MRVFRIIPGRPRRRALAGVWAVAAAIFLPACVSRANVIFTDKWPQSSVNPLTSANDANWTFTDASGSADADQSDANQGLASDPAGSAYNLTFLQNGSATEPAVDSAVTTAAANLPAFQPNTTYTFSLYAGSRSDADSWGGGSGNGTGYVVAEITDGNSDDLGSVTIDAADVKPYTNWYLFSATYTTGATVPSGDIILSLTGYNEEEQNQMSIGTVSLSAVPEPACLSLFGAAATGMLLRRRKLQE